MASISNDLLRKILIKYAGVPSKEAVLVANEMDELRQYDTAAALLADVANVRVGSFAYAIDTEAVYLKGATAFVQVAGPSSDADAFLQTKVSLAAADIKALAATQFELVAAVAGKMIVLHDLVLELEAGSEVLTESTDNMIVNYVDDSGVAATAAIEATGFIDQAANTMAVIKGVAVPAGTVAQVVNTPLVLDNTGDGEYAGNASDDAILHVTCRYSLITVS